MATFEPEYVRRSGPASALRTTDHQVYWGLVLGAFYLLSAYGTEDLYIMMTLSRALVFTIIAVLPATIYAVFWGPRPGLSVLFVALAGWGWYPLAWALLWRASGEDLSFERWFSDTNASMVELVPERLRGEDVITALRRGASIETHTLRADLCALVAFVVAAIPGLRARCPVCDRPAAWRLAGELPVPTTQADPKLAEPILASYVSDPSPLAAPGESGSRALRLYQKTCSDCGAGALRGHITAHGVSIGTTRDLVLTPVEVARLGAR